MKTGLTELNTFLGSSTKGQTSTSASHTAKGGADARLQRDKKSGSFILRGNS